jgi:hypothetical protein
LPAAPAAADRCRPPGSKVLKRSAAVLVVERRDATRQACYLPTRRVTRLDRPAQDPMVPSVGARVREISGRFVGYVWVRFDRSGTVVRVKVVDARAGKVVTDVSAYTGSTDFHDQTGFEVTDFVLGANGDAAWAARRPPRFATSEVRRAARGARRAERVASSPGIEPGSVAMNRRFVYWRDAGVAISAPAIGSDAGEAPARAGCTVPERAEVVAESERIVVWEGRRSVTKVCHRPNGRVTPIDRTPVNVQGTLTSASVSALNDRYVGYLWRWVVRGGVRARLRVLDARRGRIVTNVTPFTPTGYFSDDVYSPLPDFAMRRDGAVAWMSPLPLDWDTLEVRYAARGATDSTLLSTSATAEKGSLALNRRYVYWRDAGVAMSARVGE